MSRVADPRYEFFDLGGEKQHAALLKNLLVGLDYKATDQCCGLIYAHDGIGVSNHDRLRSLKLHFGKDPYLLVKGELFEVIDLLPVELECHARDYSIGIGTPEEVETAYQLSEPFAGRTIELGMGQRGYNSYAVEMGWELSLPPCPVVLSPFEGDGDTMRGVLIQWHGT
ncbi:MAG TPA: hypothetical protein VK171_03750 [Fimbriimonas sp.]|nr:hypothetical protein [Fimbriimonas sp.]